MQGRKDTTVYDEINTYRDHTTGEMISDVRKKVVRREKTPDFVMMFTHGLSILTKSNLTNAQAKTLFELLKYTVNNSNMLMISVDTKRIIAKETGLAQRTIGENIQALVTKEIIIKENKTYFLNPVLFGRGNWNDIKKLTQSLEIEYDFENNTAVERIKTKALYNDSDELENKSHEIIDTKQYESEDGSLNQEIIIAESEKDIHKKQQSLSFEKDSIVQEPTSELNLIHAKNKTKELDIEEMKLKLELHSKGLL
ncbi:MAG: hypothetical protein COB42_08165 [Sulfurimonas sp.]|nr:MAG: hypothetical protein COB42_08165 [Sulfurimonas sp.]